VRDDLLHAQTVERLDVVAGHRLEEVLVADAPGRIARAALLVAEDGEVDAGLLHQACHRLGDLLGAVVVGAGAADPVEHLGGALLVPLLDVHALRPGLAVALRHAPRVARLLHLLERLRGAEADLALGEGHVAAHVDDGGDVLVADRADLHAGAAGGARPQDVLVDDPARQEHGGVLGVELLALQRGLVAVFRVMLEVE
jgi:hypothetical protein